MIQQLVGACDECGRYAPLFARTCGNGGLWQPYLCEACARNPDRTAERNTSAVTPPPAT